MRYVIWMAVLIGVIVYLVFERRWLFLQSDLEIEIQMRGEGGAGQAQAMVFTGVYMGLGDIYRNSGEFRIPVESNSVSGVVHWKRTNHRIGTWRSRPPIAMISSHGTTLYPSPPPR